VIAETVGQVPLKIYRKSDANKYPDPTHPLYPLLHDEANPETTAQEFRENLTGHAALWGNAYAEIERRKSGTVKALWPLHPGCMYVDRGADNRLRYTYAPPDERRRRPITGIRSRRRSFTCGTTAAARRSACCASRSRPRRRSRSSPRRSSATARDRAA
jgi:phage portal protein BeeE